MVRAWIDDSPVPSLGLAATRDGGEAGEGAPAERRAQMVRKGCRCAVEHGQAALGLMRRDMEVEESKAVYHFLKRCAFLVVTQCTTVDLFPP
jgi:hypothetical protein